MAVSKEYNELAEVAVAAIIIESIVAKGKLKTVMLGIEWFQHTYHHTKQSSANRLCTALPHQVIKHITDEYHQHNAHKTD